MKKTIIITLLSFAILGCSRHYPRFVKNSCTGLYAIQTGYGYAQRDISTWGQAAISMSEKQDLFVGLWVVQGIEGYRLVDTVIVKGYNNPFFETRKKIVYDTVPGLGIGEELTFPDEESARACWEGVDKREKQARENIAIRKKQIDSLLAVQKWVFKCQHSYE